MLIGLPKPIAAYFAAEEAADAGALARCFSADGVVRDEGGTFTGTDAIERWNATTRAKYHHRVAPLSADVRLVRDARVQRLTRPGESRCQIGHGRQLPDEFCCIQ